MLRVTKCYLSKMAFYCPFEGILFVDHYIIGVLSLLKTNKIKKMKHARHTYIQSFKNKDIKSRFLCI